MKNVFVVLRHMDLDNMEGGREEFVSVRTTLTAAMAEAYKVKPATVLEVSPKAGSEDKPVKKAQVF